MKRFFMYGIPKSFLIKIIISLLIILGCKNVFALEKNVASSIKYNTDSSGGTYKGDEIYLGGYNGKFNVGTRYNGRLSLIEFYLSTDSFDFTTNHTYTITLNMATDDWRNHFMSPQVIKANSNGSLQSNGSLSVSSFKFVSYKKIKFNFRTNNSLSPYLFFRLYSTDYASTNSTAFTGDNNWKLSSIYINDNVSSSSGGSIGGSATPTPVPTATPAPDFSGIINSQNQNTQDIINNQNNNSQDIINNQNDNTQDIIENNNQNTSIITSSVDEVANSINNGLSNMCGNLFNVDNISNCRINESTGGLLCEENGSSIRSNILSTNMSTGSIEFALTYSWRGWSSEFIPVQNLTPYYFSYSGLNFRHFFNFNYYDEHKEFLGFSQYWVDSSTNLGITTPRNAKYVKISFSTADTGIYTISNVSFNMSGFRYCVFGSSTSKIDDTTNAVNEVNDTLKDDNVDSGVGSNFFNDFSTSDNGGISGIITKPLVLINSLLSNNSSCNALTFGIKFPNLDTKNVSLPSGCILWNNVPSNVVNIYHIFIVGFCSYYLLRRLFKDVEDLKNPEKDNVEVIDL